MSKKNKNFFENAKNLRDFLVACDEAMSSALIKYIQVHKRLTREQFASKIGKKENTISKYEAGNREITAKVWYDICVACDITMQDLSIYLHNVVNLVCHSNLGVLYQKALQDDYVREYREQFDSPADFTEQEIVERLLFLMLARCKKFQSHFMSVIFPEWVITELVREEEDNRVPSLEVLKNCVREHGASMLVDIVREAINEVQEEDLKKLNKLEK